METRQRKLALALMVFFFGVFGVYILLRAQGWIIDSKNLKLVKTGGIFLKFHPDNAKITINGIPKKTSASLIDSGTIIKNLIPKEYLVTVSKPGFKNWEKNFEVQPGLVNSASQIKLLKENLTESAIFDFKIEDFWLTKNGLVYKTPDGKIRLGNDILRGESLVSNDLSSNKLITEKNGTYFLINLDTPSSVLNINEIFNGLKNRQLHLPGKVSIKFISPHPFSHEKIIIASVNSLYLLDPQKVDLEMIAALKNPEFFAVSGDNVIIFQKNGELKFINLILKKSNSYLISLPSIINQFMASKDNKVFFLLNDQNELVFYNRNENKLLEIGKNIKEFTLQEDDKRIAMISTNDKLSVFYLDNYEGDIKREKGEILNIDLQKNKLSNFEWLEGTNYFSVLTDHDLLIGEIDDRKPLNQYVVKTGVSKYFYDKKIYALLETGELINLVF